MSASKKSGQLTCYQTGQFYLLPTEFAIGLDATAIVTNNVFEMLKMLVGQLNLLDLRVMTPVH
jgi:hypothetical protein